MQPIDSLISEPEPSPAFVRLDLIIHCVLQISFQTLYFLSTSARSILVFISSQYGVSAVLRSLYSFLSVCSLHECASAFHKHKLDWRDCFPAVQCHVESTAFYSLTILTSPFSWQGDGTVSCYEHLSSSCASPFFQTSQKIKGINKGGL